MKVEPHSTRWLRTVDQDPGSLAKTFLNTFRSLPRQASAQSTVPPVFTMWSVPHAHLSLADPTLSSSSSINGTPLFSSRDSHELHPLDHQCKMASHRSDFSDSMEPAFSTSATTRWSDTLREESCGIQTTSTTEVRRTNVFISQEQVSLALRCFHFSHDGAPTWLSAVATGTDMCDHRRGLLGKPFTSRSLGLLRTISLFSLQPSNSSSVAFLLGFS